MRAGDIVEENCSCDSAFMLEIIPQVATAMGECYHWVPPDEPLFLVMDNAGGHGTDIPKAQYTVIMEASNIQIIWQVPRSPETNMLDLGIWMAVQCAVAKSIPRADAVNIQLWPRVLKRLGQEIN